MDGGGDELVGRGGGTGVVWRVAGGRSLCFRMVCGVCMAGLEVDAWEWRVSYFVYSLC